jgi:ADP-ribose pyrophosphatase YjhB (NUDIX family)
MTENLTGTGPPPWLAFVQRVRAVAQTGLAYTENPYDRERYTTLLHLAADAAAIGADALAATMRELFEEETGPATPKVDGRAVVFRTDRLNTLEVLLVRERSDGRWALPGGWAEVGESAADGIAREVREEAGYLVRPAKLLAVLDKSRHGHPPHGEYVYTVVMQCELLGHAPAEDRSATHETDLVGFFPENALPPLSLARVTPRQISRWFDHARHPAWPADFD